MSCGIQLYIFFKVGKETSLQLRTVLWCYTTIKTTSENRMFLYVFLYIFQESYACEDNDVDCDGDGLQKLRVTVMMMMLQ